MRGEGQVNLVLVLFGWPLLTTTGETLHYAAGCLLCGCYTVELEGYYSCLNWLCLNLQVTPLCLRGEAGEFLFWLQLFRFQYAT